MFFLLHMLGGTAQADSVFSRPWSDPVDRYPLDGVGRFVPAKGRLRCSEDRLVTYRGTLIPYDRPVRVDRAFVDRLRLFEQVVSDSATAAYGRKPRRLIHMGTFSCRRIRQYPTFLSEHSLGNAIDVAGFDFAPV